MRSSTTFWQLGIVLTLAFLAGCARQSFGESEHFVSAPVDKNATPGAAGTRPQPILDAETRRAATSKGKANAPPANNKNNDPKNNDPPKTPFLRSLYDSLQNINDKDIDSKQFGNKDDVRRQLREADQLYGKIKEQNKDGIRRANNPPRYSRPTQPKVNETPKPVPIKNETKPEPVT